MTISVLIVDDEAPARARVARLLAADARFACVGEARDGDEALALIAELAPALVILDVQMPGRTGVEVAAALDGDGAPLIVFSTAHEQHAIAAFDAAAVDYLLKPYEPARFQQALDRAHARLAGGVRDDAQLRALLAALAPARAAPPLERLLVRDGEAWVPLPLDRVLRLTADDKHVRVLTRDGEHRVRQPLRQLEERLDPARFVRVHRGEIVALDAVARLEAWTHGDGLLVLVDGSTVVLSRNFRDEFLDRWGGR